MVLLGTATLFLSETSESSAYNLTALSKLHPLFLFILLAPVLSGAQVSISGLERLKDDPDATGRLLLNELQCAGCHTPPKDGFAGLPAKTAPDLGDVGSRLRESWVEGFIATPLEVAPGSGHPDILAGKAETSAKVQAESITHYLMMQKRSQPISETRGNADKGRDLYGKVGCAACHGGSKESRSWCKIRHHHCFRRVLAGSPTVITLDAGCLPSTLPRRRRWILPRS